MKKIFFLVFITVIVQKNYCQALKQYELSKQSQNICQQKTAINNQDMDDTCIENPRLTFLKECVQGYEIYTNEVLTAHFPFTTGFTYPIMAIPFNWEREWEKAFKGIPIPFR